MAADMTEEDIEARAVRMCVQHYAERRAGLPSEGSALLDKINRLTTRFITRDEAATLSARLDHGMARLVDAGRVDQVGEDIWLVLETMGDAEAACAAAAANPNVRDVTGAILAFGIAAMRRGVRDRMGVVDTSVLETARAMVEDAWREVVDAGRRHAEAWAAREVALASFVDETGIEAIDVAAAEIDPEEGMSDDGILALYEFALPWMPRVEIGGYGT